MLSIINIITDWSTTNYMRDTFKYIIRDDNTKFEFHLEHILVLG